MRTILENCRIIDGRGGETPLGYVIVEGDRIEAVAQGKLPDGSAGGETYDLAGCSVLPGMIDCHVHLLFGGEKDPVAGQQGSPDPMLLLRAAKNAERTLLAGVTTVRDLGSKNDLAINLREAVSTGLVQGPRVLASGKCICMTGGHGWPFGVEADGESEVRKAVRGRIKAGAEVIKLMVTGGVLTSGMQPGTPQLTSAELRAGVEEAHKAGRRVSGHVQGAQGLRNALAAGFDSIEHGIDIDLEAVEMFLEIKAGLVPTLSAPYNILKNRADLPADMIAKTETLSALADDSVRNAYRAGVLLAMGTDAGTPYNLHGENLKELELMCAIGISPMDAVCAATHNAARLLGIDGDVGVLASGMRADLIVVQGDPLKDISLLQRKERIAAVMKDGRFYKNNLQTAP